MTAGASSKRRPAAAAILIAAAGTLLGAGAVHATCASVPIVLTTFDPIVACTTEEAVGTVAVSLQGDARGSGRPDNPAIAVSGTGHAYRAILAVSLTGQAGGPHDPALLQESGVGISGTGPASGFLLAISAGGNAQAPVAVSGRGDSRAQLVSVSGTGDARGDTYTGDHPAPFVAISGCRAEHTPHDQYPANEQYLTVDPSRIHIPVDVADLPAPIGHGPDGHYDPYDIAVPAGATIQGVTCPL